MDKCNECISTQMKNYYYETLSNIFNSISLSKNDTIKLTFIRNTSSLSCALIRFGKYNGTLNPSIKTDKISDLIFHAIGQITLPICLSNVSSKITLAVWNNTWKLWLTGFASVTIINGCAAIGFMFKPLMKKKSYKVVMSFMIAMAVGSLTGSALLILIPDSFRLSDLQRLATSDHYDYKLKATVVFGGVYMFFLVERFLKWIIQRKGHVIYKEADHHHGSMNVCRTQKPLLSIDSTYLDIEEVPHNCGVVTSNNQLKCNGTGHTNHDADNSSVFVVDPKKRQIAPVAWMIICGDALHNFIDGLSIGAAFSHGLFKGISLSIAVFCEELPHELGDFAILLNAGMTVKQALMWNLLSAATCYLGFVIGVILGEMTSSSIWVFAIAGGMFLYISLVDMMPELNAILEEPESAHIGRLKIFIIQNIGLLFGYSIILIMAFYGDRINIQ